MPEEVENLELNINEPRTLGDWVKFADLAGVSTWAEIMAVLQNPAQGPRAALAVFWMAGTQHNPDFDIKEAEDVLLSPDGISDFIDSEFGG